MHTPRHVARIDQLADSNKLAKTFIVLQISSLCRSRLDLCLNFYYLNAMLSQILRHFRYRKNVSQHVDLPTDTDEQVTIVFLQCNFIGL